MNKHLVVRLLGAILLIEALAMLPSLAVALVYRDGDAMAFVKTIALLLASGLPMWLFSMPQERNLRAREGFVTVAMTWLAMSAVCRTHDVLEPVDLGCELLLSPRMVAERYGIGSGLEDLFDQGCGDAVPGGGVLGIHHNSSEPQL
jgi:hypothetical protein